MVMPTNRLFGYSLQHTKNMKDLFETPELIPANVEAILEGWSVCQGCYNYADLEKMQLALEAIGYTFEYGLDAVPFNLHKIEGGN